MRLRSKTRWLLTVTAAVLPLSLFSVPAVAATHPSSPAARSAAHPQSWAHLPAPHRMQPMSQNGTASVLDGPLIDHGGPIQTAPKVYVVFWDWTSDPIGERPYLTNFLSSVGGTPWLSTVDQYGGRSSSELLASTWSDPSPIPASPSDSDIQAEAVKAADYFGVGTSVNTQIVVAIPANVSQDCGAYHGALGADPDVTYTNLPYGGGCGFGTLDWVSSIEGHELAESITDPLLTAWFDANGQEIADKCGSFPLSRITTSAGKFAVQSLWSNNDNGCVNSPGHPVSLMLVEYSTSDPAPTTSQIGANFQLYNEGNTPINLSGITVRYWFTEDGTQPMSFACDYSPIGCSNITAHFNTTSLGGQDHYLELGFTAGAGTLQPGQSTGIIETRFYQNNFATMNQANDWSFNGADTTPNQNFQITLYQNGNLLTGEEP